VKILSVILNYSKLKISKVWFYEVAEGMWTNGRWKRRKKTENRDSNNGRIMRKTEMIDGSARTETEKCYGNKRRGGNS